MARNHGGEPLGSILGPVGSHWVKKMGQNRKKLPCPKIQLFDYPAIIDFSQKMEVMVMAPNHGGDTIEPILGPMGSHWVQKMGQNRKKLPCPKIRIFDYPRSSILKKMEVTVMAPNHGGDTIESILGPMGSHWVQKIGQNHKKLPCPKIRIFDYPAVIGFSQKMEFTVMAPNHGGDPLGSILGPMGPHWVQKMCQSRKKITMPQNLNFRLPGGHRFFPKMEVTVMAPNHGGDPLGSILGPVGSHWVKKMGQNRKKLPCPKIRILGYPAVIDFLKKMEVTVMAPNHGGGTIESILGPMGSHWVKKMGQNRKKLPCQKIRIFDYPTVIDFSQKMEVTIMAPNHSGDPLGSILGPVGSHWVKKMGQNRKKLPCLRIRNFDYPAVFGFLQKVEVTVMAPNHGADPLGSILGPMGSH